jgi:hypothetical protein
MTSLTTAAPGTRSLPVKRPGPGRPGPRFVGDGDGPPSPIPIGGSAPCVGHHVVISGSTQSIIMIDPGANTHVALDRACRSWI